MRVWWQINSALLRSRASDLSTNATAAFQDVGGKLNQVTGYNEIEALKKQVVDIGKAHELLKPQRNDKIY